MRYKMLSPGLLAIPAVFLLSAPALAQTCVVEDFEGFIPTSSSNTLLYNTGTALDENTVASGQGPGLVADGCTYYGYLFLSMPLLSGLEWYSGGGSVAPSRSLAARIGELDLFYDTPVDWFSLDLYSTTGAPRGVNVLVFDAVGAVTLTAIAVPGSPTTLSYSGNGIVSVRVDFLTASGGSVAIDDHVFGTGLPCPTLVRLGECGTTAIGVGARNMTPGGPVGFAWTSTIGVLAAQVPGCGAIPTGLGGQLHVAGVVIADFYGAANLLPTNGVPAAACGGHMQAVDLTTCGTTNVVDM